MLPLNHNKIRKIFATCDIWWPRLINSGMFSLYRKHRRVFDRLWFAKVPKKAIRTHQKSILVAWKKCWQMVAHTWQVGNAVCPRWISKFCQLTRTALLPTSTWGLQGLNFCSELSHIFLEHYPHVVPLVNVKQNHEHIQTTHISIHFLSIRLPSESSLPSFSPSLWQIRCAAARSSRTDASVIFDMSGSDWASGWESRNAAPRFFRIVSTC